MHVARGVSSINSATVSKVCMHDKDGCATNVHRHVGDKDEEGEAVQEAHNGVCVSSRGREMSCETVRHIRSIGLLL